jgi:hypothetical protein
MAKFIKVSISNDDDLEQLTAEGVPNIYGDCDYVLVSYYDKELLDTLSLSYTIIDL